MKSSELQLCVECDEVMDLGARDCPSCACSQAIPLDRIINRRPVETLSARAPEEALLYAQESFRPVIPRAWA